MDQTKLQPETKAQRLEAAQVGPADIAAAKRLVASCTKPVQFEDSKGRKRSLAAQVLKKFWGDVNA